jgi:uncharacterized protein YoxC
MQLLAVFGVIVAIVGGMVGWRFLGDLGRNADRSLRIGEDAATALRRTIDVADRTVVALGDGLVTVTMTLQTVDGTIDDVGRLAGATASLTETLPATLDDVDGALATVETLAGTVDGALGAVSALPFGPDYEPDVPFPDAIAGVRTALDPLADDLGELSAELTDVAERPAELHDRVDALVADIDASRRALDDAALLLDDYAATAEQARDLAITSRDDLDRSLSWMRVVLVLLGLLLAAAQLVPWWLGSRLVEASADRRIRA